MSLKKISKDQPKSFEFNDKNLEAAKKIISNYPNGKQQSAVMALLYMAYLIILRCTSLLQVVSSSDFVFAQDIIMTLPHFAVFPLDILI